MGIADGEVTSLAFCWRIERADGAGLALTSHDRTVIRDGVAFMPSPGMTPSSISQSLGLDPDSGEAGGALSSDALSITDLMLGRWNGASIAMAAIDWQTPEDEAIDLLGGELGEVSIEGESFSAELLGAAARLDRPVGPATSPECRAHFGDKKCRVDLAGRTIVARVAGTNGTEFQLDRPVGEEFLLGRLRYLSGENCGLATVVVAAEPNAVRVRDLPRAEVEIGCRVELREGCDKRLETCAARFGNAVNFRGEPHLPGTDLLTRFPGA